MGDAKTFNLPRASVRYYAIREAGESGWRLMMFGGDQAEVRRALAQAALKPTEIREVMTVLMKDPPVGLQELTGPDLWTGTGHDWVFDAAIERWRAPDEALTPLPGTPKPVDAITLDLDIPHIGWMPLTIAAGEQSVTFSASTVFDPFPELIRWLEGLAVGGEPRLLINTEGVNVTFHVFSSGADTVRFVVTNDAETDDAIDLDILVDRAALVRGIYEQLLTYWESEGLVRASRSEWRYDDEPSDDPQSGVNSPYSIHSSILDAGVG